MAPKVAARRRSSNPEEGEIGPSGRLKVRPRKDKSLGPTSNKPKKITAAALKSIPRIPKRKTGAIHEVVRQTEKEKKAKQQAHAIQRTGRTTRATATENDTNPTEKLTRGKKAALTRETNKAAAAAAGAKRVDDSDDEEEEEDAAVSKATTRSKTQVTSSTKTTAAAKKKPATKAAPAKAASGKGTTRSPPPTKGVAKVTNSKMRTRATDKFTNAKKYERQIDAIVRAMQDDDQEAYDGCIDGLLTIAAILDRLYNYGDEDIDDAEEEEEEEDAVKAPTRRKTGKKA
jgi:hypothetical protein